MGLTQHPLDSIAPKIDAAPVDEQDSDTDLDERESAAEALTPPLPDTPVLSLNHIKSPALLLDHRLRVVWQNDAALQQIWHCGAGRFCEGGTLPVFDLLFHQRFQSTVGNWQSWAAYFIQQARRMLSSDQIHQMVNQMTDRQADVISTLLAQIEDSPHHAAIRPHLHQEMEDGRVATFSVMTAEVAQGLLMIFEARSDDRSAGLSGSRSGIERQIRSIRRHPNPVRQRFSVIAANLNNASAMHLEMLADEFSLLVNHVCHRSIHTIERFGGLFCKHLDSGFYAYFLPEDKPEDSALRTIQCCFELKSRIAELSREWKVRKSWAHDIELNIGIHEAHEHIGTLSSSGGDMVSSSGSALRIASNLSRFIRGGQIWATKSLFKTMHPDTYNQLRFGVMKTNGQSHLAFVRRCFTAIKDLPDFKPDGDTAGDGLENTPVTQVFDREL